MVNRAAIIIICLVFFTLESECQKIDSLKSLLPGKSNIERADILLELAWEYFDVNNNNLASQYSREAHEIAAEIGDSLMITKTSRLTASILRNIGQADSAIKIYKKILPIAQRNEYTDMIPRVLNGLALSYNEMAQYDKALHYHFESLDAVLQTRDTTWIIVSLNNIGVVYYKLQDYQKALNYFNQCIDLKRKIGVKLDTEMMLANSGLCYAYQEDFDNAKLYIEEAIRSCNENCADHIKVNIDFAMGVIYFGLNELDEAERYFLKSYLLASETENIRFQLDDIDYLSRIYIAQDRIDRAIYYLNKAENLIDQGSHYNLEAINIYSRFFQAYNKTKDFRNASLYLQKYINLKDSIYGKSLTTNLMKLEAEYLERENTARITAQSQILALKEEVISRQKLLNVFIGAMTIMLILLTSILFKMNRQKQMINGILDQKIAERTKALEDSQGALIRATHEQSFIIDRSVAEIQSSLATIKGLCSVGLRDLPNAKEYLSQIDVTSDELAFTLQNFRELSVENDKLVMS